jgi:hypothetical protein
MVQAFHQRTVKMRQQSHDHDEDDVCNNPDETRHRRQT